MAEARVEALPEHEVKRLDWTFIGETWAVATLLSIALAVVVGGVVIAIMGVSDAVGAVYLSSIVVTFLSYWSVVHTRLHHVRHNQLANAVAVGVLHFSIALVASVITIVATGASFSDWGGSDVGNADSAMLILFAFERTGIVAILGCLLAFGSAGDTGELDDAVL